MIRYLIKERGVILNKYIKAELDRYNAPSTSKYSFDIRWGDNPFKQESFVRKVIAFFLQIRGGS